MNSKIFKGTLDHNTNVLSIVARLIARVINEAKTCLSCDKFGYRSSKMMFLDKKMKSSLSRNVHGTLYVKMKFC